jgi:outer membrane protein OmpA-like peptidoglycan-associated protein
MKRVVHVISVLALTLLLTPAGWAGEPSEPKDKATGGEKAAAAKSERPAPEPSAELAPEPAPAPQFGGGDYVRWHFMPTIGGTPGFFTLDTGETLPAGDFMFSAHANKFSRMPGSTTVLNVGWSVGLGLADRLAVFLSWDPHRHIHVGQSVGEQLSFRTPGSNPQFGNTMYRTLSSGNRPGYVEDFPFAGFNQGGLGDVRVGLQFRVASESRGDPVSFSIRNDFFIPTRRNLGQLLDHPGQTGQFNYAIHGAFSKNIGTGATFAFNTGYRFTRDPRDRGDILMTQADQWSIGAGFLLFRGSRVQFINEYSGLVFVNDATPNRTFGARNPFEGVWGARIYFTEWMALDLGYRNALNLRNHDDRHGFVVKLATSTFRVEPPPVNRPPIATCTADRTSVYLDSGDVVTVRVSATDPDGDPLTYSWTATGGTVEGTGTEVRWNSAGTRQGTYTVTVRVDDGRGGIASCAADIRVEPRPNRPPVMTCSADRTSILVGERARITAQASDPDGDPLTFTWRTNLGQIVGTGASVELDSTDTRAGTATVTGRVEDGRGGAADCTVSVGIQEPPPPPQASKISECFFRPGSARVDNVCKRVLDDVALRLGAEPQARVVIVGFADPAEARPDRLATQRAENARSYLTTEKGIPAARVDVRTAGGQAGAGRQNRRVDIIWVPQGATY